MSPWRDDYEISDDRARLDVWAIWRFLSRSYWTPGIPKEVVERSIAGSICFGLYAPGGAQAGFARAVTDGISFAWLADVFVLEQHRGRGLGAWLVESALGHPGLRDVRHVMLATADAHELYGRFGFQSLDDPDRWMIRWRQPDWFGEEPFSEEPPRS